MGVFPVCMSGHHLCVWCSQRLEEALDSPELELQTVVSHRVGDGDQTLGLWKSSHCS